MINAMWLERSSGAKAPGATKRKPAPLDAGRQRGLIARIPNHPFYGWRRFQLFDEIDLCDNRGVDVKRRETGKQYDNG